ncbi:MAG: hypothetical protein AB8H79_24420 [Myxococcota bacterium]
MRNFILLSALAITSTFAIAQDAPAADEGPKDGYIYELDEVSLQVPLVPEGTWVHDHWSGWDLKAATKDKKVEAIVWTTEYQMDILEADLEKWGSVYIAKAGERSVKEAALTASALAPEVQGTTAGQFEVTGKTESGTSVTLMGTSLPIHGYVLHVATLGLTSERSRVESSRNEIVAALKIGKPAKALPWGAPVTSPERLAGKMDAYWRPALKQERETMMRAIKSLNVPSMKGCFVGIHPQPVAKADMLVVCENKKHMFHIVNDLTYADQEAELRDAWVPDAEPSAPWSVQDRLGFWWDVPSGKRTLHVAALPIEGGVAKVAAMADGGNDAKVMEAAKATLMNNTYAPLPPAPMDEQLRYYVSYEPFSPIVLVPIIVAALALIFILGLIIFGLRRQSAQARAEMDQI